jgi:putative ABC transport system permease protein
MSYIEYREYVKIAFENLALHRLRSGLATLGIIIGVMTVISMISVIDGMNRQVANQIRSLGSDLVYVAKGNPGILYAPLLRRYEQRDEVSWEDARAIERECPTVKRAIPVFNFWAQAKFGRMTIDPLEVKGSVPGYADMNNYRLAAGRFISPFDMRQKANVCVLGWELTERFFGNDRICGEFLRIGKERFRIIGILQPKGTFLEKSMDNFILIPVTTMASLFGPEFKVVIQAQPAVPEVSAEAIREITRLMRKRRTIAPGEQDDFTVTTQDQLMRLYSRITGGIFLGMLMIGGISLLVGGIGIMNIMLVSVNERTREIGLRKALGAKTRNIVDQFLVETLILSMSGGGIGIVLGIAAGGIIASLSPLPYAVSAWMILLGTGSSIGVGLFFGLYPALKASRLNPQEALRYE